MTFLSKSRLDYSIKMNTTKGFFEKISVSYVSFISYDFITTSDGSLPDK